MTDGDDTCPDGGSGDDDNAKRAAHKAEQLFAELEAGFPESSVTTYSIGFGTGASTNRLNWIGWGGSGMGQGLTGQPNVTTTGSGTQERWNETATQLDAKRALCTTCIDAFIAPDAATLAAQLQAILDQGATLGEFTAQQSVFTSIFELVADAGGDPDDPTNRYNVFVPNLIRASFTMPGFKGQVRALQNKGTIVENWNAGQKLFDRVNTRARQLQRLRDPRRVQLRVAADPHRPPDLHVLRQRRVPGDGRGTDHRKLAHDRRQPQGALAGVRGDRAAE